MLGIGESAGLKPFAHGSQKRPWLAVQAGEAASLPGVKFAVGDELLVDVATEKSPLGDTSADAGKDCPLGRASDGVEDMAGRSAMRSRERHKSRVRSMISLAIASNAVE